ncbi:peptidoglycan-binding protein (plasmid) [Embleya sp. NBC_00888]|uniref:peptidoglycan-binding protein n=1 Tax=Embleya sp. NBC_00888 TaxID=2975960 RepID=UPI0038642C6D|nr:peptidoglycan-binding protein [Embleya sp. NBC_00888]
MAALGVGGVLVFAPGDSKKQVANEGKNQGATAPIVRGDLTVAQEIDGTLGYAGTGSLYAQAPDQGPGKDPGSGPGGNPGPPVKPSPSGSSSNPPKDDKMKEEENDQLSGSRIFTELPAVGDSLKQGDSVYRVNGRPVPLFYGDAPLWRALAKGVSNGPDVLLLKRNLIALGFGPGLQVDDKFTDGTTAAVKRWQKSLKVPQSGKVDPSMIAVQPSAVRVISVKGAVGAPAQGEVLGVSGTGRQVSVNLPADKQALARQGDKVSVRLPDGKVTTGTITSIGTVAEKKEEGPNPGTGGGGKATIKVIVTLDTPQEAGSLDGAPVAVGFTSQSRKDVLSVPVNALVALAEGGYGVEVVDPAGKRRLVGVKPGLFANGRVEISGTGLAKDQKVRVPGQ